MNKDLILIGMPGCGKTRLGRELARKLRMPFLDLDAEIERVSGKTIPEIFEESGETGFRKIESETFQGSIGSGKVIATGGGIVTVQANMETAKKGTVIFIDRPLELIFSDVDTGSRPLLSEGKERLYSLYDERYDLYKTWADIHVINSGSISETVDKIKTEVKIYEDNGN